MRDVSVASCRYAGIAISGRDASVRDVEWTDNVAGVYVRSAAARARILDSTIHGNDVMSDSACGGPGDTGACGILVHGSDAEIAGNTISGSDAYSCEYVRDGAAAEIFGGSGNCIHHNVAADNDAFAELGEIGTQGNTIAYDVVRSGLTESRFVVTRGGAEVTRGPVIGTRVYGLSVPVDGDGDGLDQRDMGAYELRP